MSELPPAEHRTQPGLAITKRVAAPFAFRCRKCSKIHEGSASFGYDPPWHYSCLSAEEKANAELKSDTCVLRHEEGVDRFIRAVLEVPIHGVAEPFTWGVWVSLSENSFNRHLETWDEPDESDSYFGWFCNRLPFQPEENSMPPVDRSQFQGLSAPILSDVMDSLGMMDRAMRPFVRPLDESAVLIGRARTGLYMPVYEARPGENPYEVEIALVDDLKPGDVAVLACNGPTERIAPWGELLSTASKMRGAVGCVTDGLVRDVRQIRELGFQVFHGGIGPLDTRGRARMMERDLPVECAGVRVRSGDIVFGDVDGVVVIPQERAAEVLARAQEKLKGENHTRAELEQGRLLGEVYKKYGVL